MQKNLIIGIGNSGRQDDGLGWAFLDRLEELNIENWDLEYRYQLQVEDAELISHYQTVWFVDADIRRHEKGFIQGRLIPVDAHSYTSHELSPETVLHLTQTIYEKFLQCHLLGISGESFDLEIGLTPYGTQNLEKACLFFEKEILKTVTSF